MFHSSVTLVHIFGIPKTHKMRSQAPFFSTILTARSTCAKAIIWIRDDQGQFDVCFGSCLYVFVTLNFMLFSFLNCHLMGVVFGQMQKLVAA